MFQTLYSYNNIIMAIESRISDRYGMKHEYHKAATHNITLWHLCHKEKNNYTGVGCFRGEDSFLYLRATGVCMATCVYKPWDTSLYIWWSCNLLQWCHKLIIVTSPKCLLLRDCWSLIKFDWRWMRENGENTFQVSVTTQFSSILQNGGKSMVKFHL